MASSPECILVALVLACSARGGNGFRAPAAGVNKDATRYFYVFTTYLVCM